MGSEDDFTVEIISQLFGNHTLGVTEGEVHQIPDSNHDSRRGKAIDLFDAKLQEVIDEVHKISDDDEGREVQEDDGKLDMYGGRFISEREARELFSKAKCVTYGIVPIL